MSLDEPPFFAPMAGEDGKASMPWIGFFSQLHEGDFGTAWLPTFENLAISGAPQVTGRYFQLSKEICVFWVHVVPGTNTTSIAGTTYVTNFPLDIKRSGFCVAVSGGLGAQPGHVDEQTNRIYTPGWLEVTVPLTVIGLAFAG